ncbi:glycoside hydrolase 3 protein [Coemansia sp. RSA 1813]|nr:glycoside hydrolase 3 protein [Coemansia sp. RSA 1646]KAJ1766405.1 glycoside hydrolase 3 protein [Coemansia sp. RSA 1843]KAJ2088588.1 glycoside hydrolase 3 protein [Coemansia sp. RSA 986]KAJ2212207.1 glycoside hydrolase 3 protein [Coemansia sp. RSA 487]KAJ2568392.1 glycoside hydrolase 3 protein [Coemansia sp. RSA 1813]
MKSTFTLAAIAAVSATAMAASPVFNALSYNPKQIKTGDCPTVDSVTDDLKVLEQFTNQVRIYSVNDCNQGEPVLRAMENTDWKIQLGLWVNQDDTVYQADKKELLRLAGVFDFKKQVSSVIVGNEAIYRKEQTQAQIADKVKDVKAALAKIGLESIPVTTSETWPSIDKTLVDAVDYVNMHAFPFWEGVPIEDAQDKMFEHIYDIQKIAGTKRVVVGETGWPSDGGNFEQSAPTLKNEQQYMKEFICRANLEKIEYVWFSAFDEAWKPTTNASDVEAHWGILDGNKKPKIALPMYDCKGFVPNTKPSEASDSSDASDASDELSGLESDGSEGQSGIDSEESGSEDTESSGAMPSTGGSVLSTVSAIAFSAAAIAASSFF